MNAFFNPNEFKDFRRVCIRSILLISPFILLVLLEMFVLPIDFFTFRIWEAASATPYRYPGPFYPNLHLRKKKEYGDAYRSGVIETKNLEWFTDAYGWRNRPEIENRKKYDAIIVGDSNMVGSFLDQKDILSEVLGMRTHKTIYSYTTAHDGISLLFSDPRPVLKTANLLILESKAANWFTNHSFLWNFYEMPDGSLNLKDRTNEFSTKYYTAHNLNREMLESRLIKQAMWHNIKASLLSNFVVQTENNNDINFGDSHSTYFNQNNRSDEKSWRPTKWIVKNGVYQTLINDKKPSISIRGCNQRAYWHTDKFVSTASDGEIIVRFDAKNSITASQHRIWIFEDTFFRSVGEILADNNWHAFEIHIKTSPGSILALQIDQPNNWQWLSIRDFRIINAKSPSVAASSQASMLKNTLRHMLMNEATPPFNGFYPSKFYKQRPANLTPLDGSGHSLTIEESQYYFYQAIKTVERKAKERNMDFIFFLMPDMSTPRLMPVIQQLRSEGVKVIAYQPNEKCLSGVKNEWYWHKADSHWREAAVRLTADEISLMWGKNIVANRPFTPLLMAEYSKGFPKKITL